MCNQYLRYCYLSGGKIIVDDYYVSYHDSSLFTYVAYPVQRTRGVVHWRSGGVNHSIEFNSTSWLNSIWYDHQLIWIIVHMRWKLKGEITMYKIKKGAKTNYKRSKIERKTKTKYNKLKLTSDPVLRARETPTLRNSEKDKTALKTPTLLRRSPNSNSAKTKGAFSDKSTIHVYSCKTG